MNHGFSHTSSWHEKSRTNNSFVCFPAHCGQCSLGVLQTCSIATFGKSFMSAQLRMRHLLQAARLGPGASQVVWNSLSGQRWPCHGLDFTSSVLIWLCRRPMYAPNLLTLLMLPSLEALIDNTGPRSASPAAHSLSHLGLPQQPDCLSQSW